MVEIGVQVQTTYQMFDEDHFESDDDKIQFFTGLPNSKVLRSVYELVSPQVTSRRYRVSG